MMEKKVIDKYLNRPQLLTHLVNANTTVCKWGRRTGKTAGVVAPWMITRMQRMPRSTGFFAGASYQKILSHMMQELIAGWDSYGLIRDEDYVIGKQPPKNWKRPIVSPLKFDYFISTKWGSGCHLIGFDHNTTSNALATDYGTLDEAKQLPYERIQKELLPTMSGHHLFFGDIPEHLSILITSDGNLGKKDSDWFNRYKEFAATEKEILEIITIQKWLQSNKRDSTWYKLFAYLQEKQKGLTLFLEANTIDNLAVIGLDFFKKQARDLDPAEFKQSILNETNIAKRGAFYSKLDYDTHTHEAPNYNYIDRLSLDSYTRGLADCEQDSDVMRTLPLKLGIDFGGTYNWAVVNQKQGNTYKALRSFYVVQPKKLKDLAVEFIRYYAPHPNKTVELYYDVNGNIANARSERTDAQEVKAILYENGWKVIDRCDDMRDNIDHYVRFRIWEHILDETIQKNKAYPSFSINRVNADKLYSSMTRAMIKQGTRAEIQKDKSDEKNNNIEQWLATHLSDCQDYIICTDLLPIYEGKEAASLYF